MELLQKLNLELTQVLNKLDSQSKETELLLTSKKWVQKYSQMLVDHVLVNGIEKVQTNKRKTQSFTLLIEISLKELMVTQIHTLS